MEKMLLVVSLDSGEAMAVMHAIVLHMQSMPEQLSPQEAEEMDFLHSFVSKIGPMIQERAAIIRTDDGLN